MTETVGIHISAYIRDSARDLLSDTDSYSGDHGFTGEQLDAWDEQRGALLVALAYIAGNQPVPFSVKERVRNAVCPREVGEETITEEQENDDEHYTECNVCGERIEHFGTKTEEVEVANPDYSHGTDEGAEWVNRATDLMNAAPTADRDLEISEMARRSIAYETAREIPDASEAPF